ncbi:hypothetical protein ACHQM5_015234 [Ranunculus cassubicifolius]
MEGDENAVSEKKPISMGPWGPDEGYEWSFNEDGDAIIKQIVVYGGELIDSLTIKYEQNGYSDYAKFGGSGGGERGKINLDYPTEYLTSVSGYYQPCTWGEGTMVTALTFVSNVRVYGPIGNEGGSHFELPLKGGMIVGFHGKMDKFINSIGVYLKPC